MAIGIVDRAEPAVSGILPEHIRCLAFHHWTVLRGYLCSCQYEGRVSGFENNESRLSNIQTAIEVSRNAFHGQTDLSLADGIVAWLDHQNSVVGIEVHDGVEVLLIDRLVRPFDQQSYRMLVHSYVANVA